MESKAGSKMRIRQVVSFGTPATICVAAWISAASAQAATIVVGRDASQAVVTEFRTFNVNGATVSQTGSVQPFGPGFHGGARVAMGDVNHNGTIEVIAGSGPDANLVSSTNTFDTTPGSTNYALFPYTNFHGGLYVAAGNVNNNGFDDIVIGPGPGIGPLVRVFDGGTTTYIHAFNAFDANYTGGVRVAAGDVTGDGRADIYTATGPGSLGQVKVFNGVSLAVERNFIPFGANFTGGVFVAAGDVNGDGVSDIICSADAGGSPNVNVYDGTNLSLITSFLAFDPTFAGGVRIAAADVNGDGHADIIAGAGPGGSPTVKIFSGLDQSVITQFLAFEPGFSGGVYVGASVPEPSLSFIVVIAPALVCRRRSS
jgi:hypothetical protein